MSGTAAVFNQRLVTLIPQSWDQALRRLAHKKSIKMSELVRAAVREMLAKEGELPE